jgi:hypothetical protein
MSPQETCRKSCRKIVVAALVTTLAVNLLLLLLFDYAPPPPLKVPVKPFRTMMLDLSSPQRHWHHEVNDWILYQNPSLMSRPDYRFGYSRVAQMPSYRAVLPALQVEPPDLIVRMAIRPFEMLPAGVYPHGRAGGVELQGLRTIDPRSINTVYPQTEPLSYPLVVADGRPLRKIRFEAVNVPPNSKPTRLLMNVEAPGMLPRVVVTGSSGDAALDREAVRVLLEHAGQASPDANSSHELIVYWRKDGGAS